MDSAIRVLSAIAGAALFAATVHAIFINMLVPRPRSTVIGTLANAPSRMIFRWLAFRRGTFAARDSVLAVSGPVSVLAQLAVFAALFVLASALMVYGVSSSGFPAALYQAGSSLLTLGIVEPASTGAVTVGLVTAFVGLVLIAVLVGYLLALYAAYSQRESAVAELGLLAGEPAWGPEFLCRASLLPHTQRIPIYTSWISWMSDVRLNHDLYPVLNMFRSVQPRRHWLVSLLAILDAAALELTTLQRTDDRSALMRVMAEGVETLSSLNAAYLPSTARHAANTIAADNSNTQLPLSSATRGESVVIDAISADARASLIGPNAGGAIEPNSDPGITREEWQYACGLMSMAGLAVRPDMDAAWAAFSALRCRYAHNAYAIADRVYATPAPWTGVRHPTTEEVWPNLVCDRLDRGGEHA